MIATRMFANRRAAGLALAERLERFRDESPLVLALPRGGVPVAFEVARQLGAELDLLLVRKLGAPQRPEVGIGAIIDGEHPEIVLNQSILPYIDLPPGYIHNESHRQLAELERRRKEYVGDREPTSPSGRTVIVVDDGIATGGTVAAALKAVRKRSPAKLILAVPVAPRDALERVSPECDEIVCLVTPEPFFAVGAHYSDFEQTSDEEVRQLLAASSTNQ